MSVRRRQDENTTQVELTPFKLDIPVDMTVTPKWEVKLSDKRIAIIYATTIPAWVDATCGKPHAEYESYRVVLRNGKGDVIDWPSHTYYNGRITLPTFDDKVLLCNFLSQSSKIFNTKRVKKTEVTSSEDED